MPKNGNFESNISENLESFRYECSFRVDFHVPLSDRWQDFVAKTIKRLCSKVFRHESA